MTLSIGGFLRIWGSIDVDQTEQFSRVLKDHLHVFKRSEVPSIISFDTHSRSVDDCNSSSGPLLPRCRENFPSTILDLLEFNLVSFPQVGLLEKTDIHRLVLEVLQYASGLVDKRVTVQGSDS